MLNNRPKTIRLIFFMALCVLWSSIGLAPQPAYADPLSQLTCRSITPITMSIADHGTGEKPQSKTWTYANEWWAVFPVSSGTWLWKLDQSSNTPSWTQVLQLSNNANTKADAKVVGSVVHVLLYDLSNTHLVSVEYSGNTYQLWSQRTAVSNISLPNSEIATIDIDSTGRLWLATESSNSIIAYYNDSPYTTAGWQGPITVSTFNINSDDIGVVTALPGNKIGVLWSNQGTDQFLFRVHNDSDPATTWQPVEEAAADNGIADDHVNVAVASNGTLYAAVKTTGAGQMKLLVRQPNGSWDQDYDVDTSQGTRPIVQLNEVAGNVTVIYPTSTGTGGDIVYRESSTSSINFGSAHVLQSGKLNDPSSMKDNYTDELVVVFFNPTTAKIHGEFCQTEQTGPQTDLALSQTDSPDPVVVNNPVTYTLTVTNQGSETANAVTVTNTLPSGVTFGSATPQQGSCSPNTSVVTCSLGALNANSTTTIAIVVTPTQAGTITNMATVTSTTADPNSSNNSASQSTTVNNVPPANADLGVTKTGTTGPIDVGQNINYTVAVVNNGPQTASSVVVTDNLPAGVTFVSATPGQGSCSHSNGVVTCNVGTMADDATVSIPLVVTATAGGTLTNNVTVTGNVTDSVSGNNSDSHDTEVIGPSIVAFTAVHDAHVNASTSNTTNYGNETTMRLRNASSGTNYNAFVKFDVTGLTGSVVNATLKLTVQAVGNDGDNIYAVSNDYLNTSTAWVETGINGSNAPTISGVVLDSGAAGTANVTIEYNVTSAITGNGTFSFGIRTNSTNSRYLHSSEATTEAYRPQLVVSTSQNPPEEADITVSPTSLSAGQEPDTQSVQTVTVGNVGDADLTWTVAENNAVSSCSGTSNISWVSASPTGGTTAVNDSDNVDITFNSAGLSDGTHQGTLCVNSNDPDTPTVSVPVTLQVCSPATALSITNITLSGNTQTVHWSGSATNSFELWWGINTPYFTPGSDCANSSNCAVVDKNNSSHGHTVNSSDLYSYILIAVNSCGPNVVASEDSNRLARFSFGVVPGN